MLKVLKSPVDFNEIRAAMEACDKIGLEELEIETLKGLT